VGQKKLIWIANLYNVTFWMKRNKKYQYVKICYQDIITIKLYSLNTTWHLYHL